MKAVAKCRKWGDLGWLLARGHVRSLKITPFDSAHMNSYILP